jgi:DNA-binding response OmpR family regulator
LYICDTAEDISDALYHLQVRYYNAILIQEDDLQVCKKFLKIIDAKSCAFIVLTANKDKKFEMSILKNGGLAVIHEPFCQELLLAKLQSIHPENFITQYNFKNYFILDNVNKTVVDLNQNQLNIKGKSFEILSYLLKTKQFRVISKDEIVGVLWDEPEMVSNNIVEVNINSIRNELRKFFNLDIVSTIRNRGYQIKQ